MKGGLFEKSEEEMARVDSEMEKDRRANKSLVNSTTSTVTGNEAAASVSSVTV